LLRRRRAKGVDRRANPDIDKPALLEHLGQGERSVEDLAVRAGLTLANTSRHLQLLRRAALVVADATASASTIGSPATTSWLDCLLC